MEGRWTRKHVGRVERRENRTKRKRKTRKMGKVVEHGRRIGSEYVVFKGSTTEFKDGAIREMIGLGCRGEGKATK